MVFKNYKLCLYQFYQRILILCGKLLQFNMVLKISLYLDFNVSVMLFNKQLSLCQTIVPVHDFKYRQIFDLL
jgi:hypothetical protein